MLRALIYWLRFCLLVQEEIKINSVTVFVNPYAELDEEEEKKAIEEKEKEAEDEDKVSVLVKCSFVHS